jgi:predicted SAM-dependent methyltransferase
MPARRLINFGCGTVFHPAWVNFDAWPTAPGIHRVDVRAPLPLPNGTVDMCYSSHLLEHLAPTEAIRFLSEQRRIMKPGGLIRVAVPDLGKLCETFVDREAHALAGDKHSAFELEYTYLEIFDQAVRTAPGGELYNCWLECPAEHRHFVESRAGDEFRMTMARLAEVGTTSRRTWRVVSPGRVWRFLRERGVEFVARLVLGRAGAAAVREGFFRQRGEVHRAMYDEARLGRRLVEAGFRDPVRMTATQSLMPGFDGYELDAVNGRVRKPDSLFMEAVA